MNKMLKKLLIVLSCISMCLIPSNIIVAEDEGINIEIDITENTDSYVVTVTDDPIYAEYEPEITVNTKFTTAYVYDADYNGIECTIDADGVVAFNISSGGVYTIVETCTHHIVKVDEVAPTCLLDGEKEHYTCSICGENYLDAQGNTIATDDDILIPNLDHDFVDGVCTRCYEVRKTIVDEKAKEEILKYLDDPGLKIIIINDEFDISDIQQVKVIVMTSEGINLEDEMKFLEKLESLKIDVENAEFGLFEIYVELIDSNGNAALLTEIPGDGLLVDIPMAGNLKVEDGFSFEVLELHDGKVERVTNTVNKENSKITIKSKKYSTFLVAKYVPIPTPPYNPPKTGVN